MCLSPIELKDRTRVACRHCEICRTNRLNDLIGRCVAEQSVSSTTLAVTLTYAGDVPEAAVLCYSDVQKFLKRLRFDGYRVRYIVAGEYGAAKGRAHWHIILFFRGKAPDVEMDRRFNWDYWPAGFSYFQRPDYKGFRYVLKYALKDQTNSGSIRALSMSKVPPLGHDFFMRLAGRMVSQKLALHAPEYSFSDVLDRSGKPRRYWLQGRMREMFLERYCSLWRKTYGKEPYETDWLREQWFDKIARKEMSADNGNFQRDLDAKRRPFRDPRAEDFLLGYDLPRAANGFLFLDASPDVLVTSYDDGSATLDKDGSEWILGPESVEQQLLPSGLSLSQRRQVCLWLQSLASHTKTKPLLRL